MGTIAIDISTTALFDAGYGGAPTASTGSIVETTSAVVAGHTTTALGTPTYTAGTSTLAVTHYTADAQNAGQVFSVGLSITGANATTSVAAAASGAAGALQGTDTLGGIATSTGHELSISGSTMTFYVAENNGAATNNVQYYQYTVTGLDAGAVLDKVDTTTVGTYTDAHGNVTSSSASGTGASIFNIDISTLTDSAADQAKLNAFQKQVDAAISNVTASASALGTARSRITSQSSFVLSLQTSLNNGVGSLVDADLNVASTRLQALQVQQQLGVQSLSIANQSTQSILKLFQ